MSIKVAALNRVKEFVNLMNKQFNSFEVFGRAALQSLNNFSEQLDDCETNDFLPLLEEFFNLYFCCMDESQFLIDGAIHSESHLSTLPSEHICRFSIDRFLKNGSHGREFFPAVFIISFRGFGELRKSFANKRYHSEMDCQEMTLDILEHKISSFQCMVNRLLRDLERFTAIDTIETGSSSADTFIKFKDELLPLWTRRNSLWHSMSYTQRLELKSKAISSFIVYEPDPAVARKAAVAEHYLKVNGKWITVKRREDRAKRRRITESGESTAGIATHPRTVKRIVVSSDEENDE